ncbi:MAG: alpha/beta fold hydrolase [Myxococcales bacterium]|nr:alpha/beta fold hydrolase [Myxococcales bacterium]
MLDRQTFFVDNGDNWQLALHRHQMPDRLDRKRRPLVLVPGFAMNSFVLGYHPRGASLVEYLAAQGFEVWCTELRGQGDSRPGPRASRRFGLADLGLVDLAAALEGVRRHSDVDAEQVDAIGCSLGATFVFMQAAWWPIPRIARIVNLGGPMRWTSVHPTLRALSTVPALWGAMAFRGTRRIARLALPLAARVPGLLHVYLHPAICDLSEPATLVQTVDDPIPSVNIEIARWIRDGDLVVEGRNLTHAVAELQQPLLTIVANADGIVPEATTCSAHNIVRSANRRVIYAGDEHRPMAHADLFISDLAEAQVFRPLSEWLLG